MEIVWNFQEKWKLSTNQALLLLLAAAAGAAAATTATLLRRLKSRGAPAPAQKRRMIGPRHGDGACGWATLIGSLRWSRARKWADPGPSGRRETPLPLLGPGPGRAGPGGDVVSPVWQRPILMGEKCELPRFSGLILYDQNGQLCDVARRGDNPCKNVTLNEEKSTAKAVRTTLRDLL